VSNPGEEPLAENVFGALMVSTIHSIWMVSRVTGKVPTSTYNGSSAFLVGLSRGSPFQTDRLRRVSARLPAAGNLLDISSRHKGSLQSKESRGRLLDKTLCQRERQRLDTDGFQNRAALVVEWNSIRSHPRRTALFPSSSE